MSSAALSALVLGMTLVLFVSGRIRHDLVALAALGASLVLGLVSPARALAGFADPAVVTVAAVLVVGRAIELSGAASAIARVTIPNAAPFSARLAVLLLVGAVLSAFMNNIAALVITMPIASEIARDARRPPGAVLMPLAFATILGGMTTLIGTPANLILSSVREEELGTPFGFFAMSEVGLAVTLGGLIYLVLAGWRLLPSRASARQRSRPPWRVYELGIPPLLIGTSLRDLRAFLRGFAARPLAVHRAQARLARDEEDALAANDRVLLVSREDQISLAERTSLTADPEIPRRAENVTARVAVAHGSLLVGEPYAAVALHSRKQVHVVAAGPRAARLRLPFTALRIEAGDQLYLRGDRSALASFLARARLLEIDRFDPMPVSSRRAGLAVSLFLAAIVAVVVGGLPPAIAFLFAAAAMAAMRLLPSEEVYRSVDWGVVVLLAAMIPVGQSFETSGAAAVVSAGIGQALAGAPLVVTLGSLCLLSLLLSIFLNNVATAIIMGPLAIDAARLLGVAPDAALLAVLIGVSSDFLTPIGHQNNLLVMGPGGYRFTDYARMGAPLVLLVVVTTALVLGWRYG